MARAAGAGFTLLELMVVVLIISLLAVMAVPMFSSARNDRLAFDHARRYEQLLHRARARASGRGAAHLVLLSAGTGGRGDAHMFEALDSNATVRPVSSCKVPGQWADALAYKDGDKSTSARFVDSVTIGDVGVNQTMDVNAVFKVASADALAVAICTTPSGSVYVGAGDTTTDAVKAMQSAPPFNDVVEILVRRHASSKAVGITRRVIVPGSAAPRLKSE